MLWRESMAGPARRGRYDRRIAAAGGTGAPRCIALQAPICCASAKALRCGAGSVADARAAVGNVLEATRPVWSRTCRLICVVPA